MIVTFSPDFQSFCLSCSKASNFRAIRVAISAQSLASLYTISFSRHLVHFAADGCDLSYTKMAIFPTLKYTAR